MKCELVYVKHSSFQLIMVTQNIDYWSFVIDRKRRRASKEIHCEIIENIENNYQMWSRRIKEMELEKQACSKTKAKDSPSETGGITEEEAPSNLGANDKKETEVWKLRSNYVW